MTSDLTHDFAERLHSLKAERDLTVREMAERCGLGKKRMENYLSRHAPTQPGLDALAAIAVGLQVAPNWLVLGIGSPDISEDLRGQLDCYVAQVVRHIQNRQDKGASSVA